MRHAEHPERLREGLSRTAGHRMVVTPPDAVVAGYVDKVTRHAYRVTDEDIDALKRAGHDEDAIFEITVSAATRAGLTRLERGLAASRGEG